MKAILITRCGCMRQIEIKSPMRFIVLPLEKADFKVYCCEYDENHKGILVDRRIFETQYPFHPDALYITYREVDK